MRQHRASILPGRHVHHMANHAYSYICICQRGIIAPFDSALVPHCTALHCTAQCDTTRHGVVRHDTKRHETTRHDMAQHDSTHHCLHHCAQHPTGLCPGARRAWDCCVSCRLSTDDCASSASHQQKQTSLQQEHNRSLGSPVHQV